MRPGLSLIPLILLTLASPALAGPPFITDDPAPTDHGAWEFYGFVQGTKFAGATEATVALDVNYGFAPDWQVTAVLPVGVERDGGTRAGVADVALAVKHKFLHEEEGGWLPALALYPTVTLPTGDRRFGAGKVGGSLSLFAEKRSGAWALFGGGGYTINPGAGNRDNWQGGIALSRDVGERFMLGGEIYARTRDQVGGRSAVGAGVGGSWALNDRWSLLASGGPTLHNRRENGRWSFYFSVLLTD